MSGRPLQSIGYRASAYERPNDRWSCGQLACGEPCPFGPSSGGACGWTCVPRESASGGLECGRPGAHGCELGPTRDAAGRARCSQVACQPAPSIRRRRGLLSIAVVALTLAALGLAVTAPELRERLVSPGALSRSHAALGCADCHAAVVGSETRSWTAAAVQRDDAAIQRDSARCAACHGLPDPTWRFAHTLPATPAGRGDAQGEASLAALQSDSRGRWPDAAAPGGPSLAGATLAGASWLLARSERFDAEGRYRVEQGVDCALCHGEHHGRQASPRQRVSDARCSVCHTLRFPSFSEGHPELARFGRRRLAGNQVFTHGAHYGSYGLTPKDAAGHPDPSRAVACAACHVPDGRGRHMVLKPRTYETECLRCHQATTDPILLLQAPSGAELRWMLDPAKRPYLPRLPDPTDAPTLLRLLLPGEDARELREDLGELRGLHNALLELSPLDQDGDEAFSEGDLNGPPELKPLRRWLADQAKREGLSEEETARVEEAQELLKKVEKDRRNLSRALRKAQKAGDQAGRVQAYATRVRSLLAELAAGRLERLRQALGLPAHADLRPLAAVFPKAQLEAFRAAWFDPQGSTLTRNLKLEPARDALNAWQGGGRLVASDALGGLRYEGYTHLDPFLRALLDLAAQAGPEAQRGVHALLGERCAKCHALAPDGPAGLAVQWQAMREPPEAARRLTYFAHAPHQGYASCAECHQLQPRAANQRREGDFELAPRWRALGQDGVAGSGCRECHTPAAYGASCQLCHDYHAGALTPGAGGRPASAPTTNAGTGAGDHR
ncbi:MAG: hypothetical protein AB7N76_29375 [Planctomycetota bacterium]